MGGGAVIPERHTARRPAKTHGEFGPHHVLPQKLQHDLALAWRQADDGLQERRAYKQRAFAGFRMHPDEGMLAHQRALAHQFPILRRFIHAGGRRKSMQAAQALDYFLHGRRQRVVSRDQVGELGVAAVGRHNVATQDRRRGWIDRGGDVGVPARPRAEQRLALQAVGLAMLGHGINLRELAVAAIHDVPGGGFTELARGGNVRVVIERLIAKEHHFPAQQRGAHGTHMLRRQWSRQIDTVDFRTDVYGHGHDFNCTGLLRCCFPYGL